MQREAYVLCVLIAVFTFACLSPASAANTENVSVYATTNFFPSNVNRVHAYYWGVGVIWSTLRTQPTHLHAFYSYCSPRFPGGVPGGCPDPSDTGAAFDGVIPRHAFRILKEVPAASNICRGCKTLPHDRTIASARLDVTVPFTEVTARPSPSFAVSVHVTWTLCRRAPNEGDVFTEIASGTLAEGHTVLVDGPEGFNAFDPLLNALPGGLASPDAAALPLCPPGT